MLSLSTDSSNYSVTDVGLRFSKHQNFIMFVFVVFFNPLSEDLTLDMI